MTDSMAFLQDQMPRALAHGLGAAAGVTAAGYIPLIPSGYALFAGAALGAYVGNIAYTKFSTDGDIDWQFHGDTMGASAGAIASLYLGLTGNPMLAAGAGALVGDIVASYLGY